MRKIYLLSSILLFLSCVKQSELSKEFNCKPSIINDLETIYDVRNVFSITLPNTWKTNLYEDVYQSSIFSADTTKQLTETYLIDVSYIKNNIQFNDLFKLKIEQENLSKKLVQIKSKELKLIDKPSYLSLYKGKKSNVMYQKMLVYIKLNNTNFILAKAEVYGDSLVEERLCKALQIIENIKTHQ
ncbi:hypothetical protein DUT90_07365 [Polaribacter sp. WD7]|uniref:hypothetical protein n=1 Tax=Polaribacter sp. WD7 TaxID=2269061 RepID=UPI000DF29FED|nr:hypothetical protein [Polaribacter sp. WD7]RCS26927.1 hypothetical protein DUT90_07365 [Polaribacter sp. WD7]